MTVKELLEVDVDGYHKEGYRDEGGRQPLRSIQAHVRCHEGDSDYQADFATGYVCTQGGSNVGGLIVAARVDAFGKPGSEKEGKGGNRCI